MNHNQIFHTELEKIGCLLDGFPAPVHIGDWLGEDDLLRIDASCPVQGFKALGVDRKVAYLGETIYYLKSDVMPAHSIPDPRIP